MSPGSIAGRSAVVSSLCLLAALIAAPLARAATPSFSDQTVASGLISVAVPLYDLGSWCCFQGGGGVVGDFNNDGWQDVFHPTGGGNPDKLFINNGDGTFTERGAEWGVALAHRSTAAAAADFDGDGWVDLYVTSFGPPAADEIGHHKLYRNRSGRGFVDVAERVGVNRTSETDGDGWGPAWGDYDLDGDLDLAVAGFKSPDANRLFRQDGDRFTDVTATAELEVLKEVNGYTPRFIDMDGDRYPELIWIGDFGTSVYLVNNGDGTFSDFTEESGTSHDGSEMGMAFGDFDEDGRFDFYTTTVLTNNLYLNRGGNRFFDAGDILPIAETGVGWGTEGVDFNHDTLVDIVVTSMDAGQYAFLNRKRPGGRLRFADVTAQVGLVSDLSGRGLSAFDYDNDGDRDLVFFPNQGPIQLFRNDLSGAGGNWLRIFLDPGCAEDIPPHGVGSVVKIRIDNRVLMGRIDGGSNHVSHSELSAHFGLGFAGMVDQIRVRWSNGDITTLTDIAANQTLTVTACEPVRAR